MADPTINPDSLKLQQEALTNIRNIRNELETIANRTKASISLARTFNSVEIDILKTLKGQSSAGDTLINAEVKMLESKNKVLKLEKSSLAIKQQAAEQYLKDLKSFNALKETQDKFNKGVKELDKQFGGLYLKFKELKTLWKTQPELAIAKALAYTFEKMWLVFQELDSSAAEFRKSIGLTRKDSVDLETMSRNVAISYMRLGVTAKDVYDSVRSLADTIGSVRVATDGMVKNMSLLAAQVGVSTKVSAQFLKTMSMVSRTTMDAQKDMLLFTQHMSAAVGVPLDSVMNDVAEASESSYQFLSRSSIQLAKAAVEAKLMGTSIVSATKSSATLLSFTESVKSEMEASVLLGKSLNLQKARELSYNRDIAGLNKEILRLAQESNFEQLDPFQQDAVAKALGKSSGEIATMLQADRERVNIMRAMTVEQRRQYDEMTKANKSKVKDYAELARKELESISNQKATAAISLAWHSIIANISSVILPHIANVLTGIAKIVGTVSNVFTYLNEKTHGISSWLFIGLGAIFSIIKAVSSLNSIFSFLGKPLITMAGTIDKIGSLLFKPVRWTYQLFTLSLKIIESFGRLGGVISRSLGFLGQGAARIFGWLNPISKIITAFSVGFGIGTLLNKFKFVQDAAQTIWLAIFKIGDGIKEVGGTILNALKKPFVDAWVWLKGLFLGNSPSTLGLMIVDGIVAVESMLMKALISPFQKAWDLVKSLPIISHLFGSKNVGAKISPEAKAGITVDRPTGELESKKVATNNMTDAACGISDELSKKMGAIVDAINSLRDDMKNGMLNANVYIDSQKLDSAVGRRLAYTGQLT